MLTSPRVLLSFLRGQMSSESQPARVFMAQQIYAAPRSRQAAAGAGLGPTFQGWPVTQFSSSALQKSAAITK